MMKAMRYGVVVLVVGVWIGSAAGRFRRPDYIPAERLIENATAYIAEEPNDPTGYYILARIHYLVFVNKASLVGTFNEENPPSIIPYWWSEYSQNWGTVRPTTEELVAHAGAAQWNFYQAIALDPNNALYHLGQASLGEQYFEFLQEASPAPMPRALASLIVNSIREMYFLAYELSVQADLEREWLPISGLNGIVSYEAGSAFVRLWEGEQDLPQDVQEKIASIKANLATLEELPLGAITPIVLSLEENSSLAELLAPAQTVSFDLDGDGRVEARPWVRPTTGFLVRDNDRDGRITSGREMFGSVTWWMFFPNGYRALDVLDDSRDGWLEAGELEGISVWFDRNSNGVSDTGELVSLESLGISSIATRATGHDGQSPMCTSGLKLKDGRTLATYDWIAPAVKPGTLGDFD